MLRRLRQLQARFIAQFGQGGFDLEDIMATNQQVEIRELAQRNIAIQSLRQ